jgi:hypothetical protein
MNNPWLILAAWAAAAALLLSARSLYRWLAGRRKDREWHAYIAAKPRGAEALDWLRGGPEVWRHGCPRTAAPGLDRDGRPLTRNEERLLSEIDMDSLIDVPEPVYEPERGDLA